MGTTKGVMKIRRHKHLKCASTRSTCLGLSHLYDHMVVSRMARCRTFQCVTERACARPQGDQPGGTPHTSPRNIYAPPSPPSARTNRQHKLNQSEHPHAHELRTFQWLAAHVQCRARRRSVRERGAPPLRASITRGRELGWGVQKLRKPTRGRTAAAFFIVIQ